MKNFFSQSLFVILFFFHSLFLFGELTIFNVSYDATRNLYQEYNRAFTLFWKSKTGEEIRIINSYGSSGAQSHFVQDGGEADVVTLARGYDVDILSQIVENGKSLVSKTWENNFPYHSSPYHSLIVFLVRKDNPKNIHDWDDLQRKDISFLTTNPKTSGGACWIFLSLWSYVAQKFKNNEKQMIEDVQHFYQKAMKNGLPPSTRVASIAFTERNMGDILICWENEAYVIKNTFKNQYDIIMPSITMLTEPVVALVNENIEKHQNRAISTAYLNYLYSVEGQKIILKNFFRPVVSQTGIYDEKMSPKTLKTIRDFGGWLAVQDRFFKHGRIFDQIMSSIIP